MNDQKTVASKDQLLKSILKTVATVGPTVGRVRCQQGTRGNQITDFPAKVIIRRIPRRGDYEYPRRNPRVMTKSVPLKLLVS